MLYQQKREANLASSSDRSVDCNQQNRIRGVNWNVAAPRRAFSNAQENSAGTTPSTARPLGRASEPWPLGYWAATLPAPPPRFPREGGAVRSTYSQEGFATGSKKADLRPSLQYVEHKSVVLRNLNFFVDEWSATRNLNTYATGSRFQS